MVAANSTIKRHEQYFPLDSFILNFFSCSFWMKMMANQTFFDTLALWRVDQRAWQLEDILSCTRVDLCIFKSKHHHRFLLVYRVATGESRVDWMTLHSSHRMGSYETISPPIQGHLSTVDHKPNRYRILSREYEKNLAKKTRTNVHAGLILSL